MRRLFKRLTRNESGATALEYGLIIALVFLVAVGAMTNFGSAATGMFDKASAAISQTLK